MNETTEQKKNSPLSTSRPRPLLLSLFSTNKQKGEATAGKTQLCLRLLLTAQLPEELGGLDGSALWLCSEKGDPPVRRLAQLAKGGTSNNRPCPSSASPSAASASAPPPPSHAAPSTDNVFVEKGLGTPLELMEALDRMEPLMTATATADAGGAAGGGRAGGAAPGGRGASRKRIRLVVVDSLAALFRDAAAATDTAAAAANGAGTAGGAAGGEEPLGGSAGGRQLYAARAAALFAVAVRLKRLADDHALAVVVVNQVTDVISDGLGEDFGGVSSFPPSALSSPSSFARQPPTHTAGLRLVSSGREVAPALGLAWASCVGIRLFLSRAAPVGSSFGGGGGGGNGDGENLVPTPAKATAEATAATRHLQVVFAPHLPPSSCPATVDERGLVGVVVERTRGGGERQQKRPAAPAAAAPPQQPVVVVCSGVFADDDA